jgi:hypothetical protein
VLVLVFPPWRHAVYALFQGDSGPPGDLRSGPSQGQRVSNLF